MKLSSNEQGSTTAFCFRLPRDTHCAALDSIRRQTDFAAACQIWMICKFSCCLLSKQVEENLFLS